MRLSHYIESPAEGLLSVDDRARVLPLHVMNASMVDLARNIDDMIGRTKFRYEISEDIGFCLIDDEALKARCYQRGETRLISISNNLLSSFSMFFCAIVRTAAFCRHFAISSPDEGNGPAVPRSDWFDIRTYQLPSTKYQMALAFQMQAFAARIIAAHELAHIVNGHLSLSSELSASDRRCLEYDADCFAVNTLMLDAVLQCEETRRWPLVEIILFSSFCLWQIEDMAPELIGSWERSYPPASFRALTSLDLVQYRIETWAERDTAFQELEKSFKVGSESLIAAIYNCLGEAGAIHSTAKFNMMQNALIESDYSEHLRKTWASLRPRLDSFALGKIPLAE